MLSGTDRILDALRRAPRRFRLPELPATPEAARAAGPVTVIAFELERLRRASGPDAADDPDARTRFTRALAAVIAAAMDPAHGDALYRARVLRTHDPVVAEWAALAVGLDGDLRRVRRLVEGVAHPARLDGTPAGPLQSVLARLHQAAADGDWPALRALAAQALAQAASTDPPRRVLLERLLAEPALARLERVRALRDHPAVRHHEALVERAGQRAGSDEAVQAGRVAARRGDDAENEVARAFSTLAGWLDAATTESVFRHRVVQGLKTPAALQAARKVKAEWDVALLREQADRSEGADIVLLAEVKATPSAAVADWPRLLRGLSTLAEADADRPWRFASPGGPVDIAGRALRRLAPADHAPPAQVLYCCPLSAEPRPPAPLGPAARACLLAEPASLGFAWRLWCGEPSPDDTVLREVWEAVAVSPRLAPLRAQHEAARRAREAMLHPDDLLRAVARALGRPEDA